MLKKLNFKELIIMKKVLSIFSAMLLAFTMAISVYAVNVKVDVGSAEGVLVESETEATTAPETAEKETRVTVQQPDDSYSFETTTLPELTSYVEEEITETKFVRRLYNVSFRAFVDDGVKDYVDITVLNLNTKQSYSFRLFEINQYFSVNELPAGEYELTSGAAAGDALNEYPVETIYFIIGKQPNTFVPFNVGSPKEPYVHDEGDFTSSNYELPEYETMSESDIGGSETTKTVEDTNEKPVKKKSNFFSKAFPILAIIVIIVIYVFRKKQNSEPFNKRENDYRF